MTTRAPERPTSVDWDEDRPGRNPDQQAGAKHLSFSTDDVFYKATRDALPWTAPDSDGFGADPGRILIPATWVECLFKKAPCRRPASFKDSEQGPYKFLTQCLHLEKYINPNLDLLIDQGLLRTGLPGASEQVIYYQRRQDRANTPHGTNW